MSRIVVLGGGITGRLVAHKYPWAVVYEASPALRAHKLTRMWGTNYLWKPIPGIPCRSFNVYTTVDGQPPTEDRIAQYKRKIGKPEDIGNWGLQFEPQMTGYDFMTTPTPPYIRFERKCVNVHLTDKVVSFKHGDSDIVTAVEYDILISTIPFDAFLKILFAPLAFDTIMILPSAPLWVTVNREERPVYNGMEVNYISDPDDPRYRTCHRDGFVHTEWIRKPDLPGTIEIKPGKIRRGHHVKDVREELASKGVVTFGRFGSWEPDELVHETYDRIVRWGEDPCWKF